MSGQDWSIKIVPASSSDLAEFTPNPQQAQVSDLLSWNNRTGDKHWPWPTDSDFNLMSEEEAQKTENWLSTEIPPWESSTPAYVCPDMLPGVTQKTLYYACKNHDKEHGTIDVTKGS
ncbi:MAG TPA: hypothetical protein VGD79_03315 [Thermoanaerobaculia bacterium]|jgi:hypothetical protein